jgi:hypothetical protein
MGVSLLQIHMYGTAGIIEKLRWGILRAIALPLGRRLASENYNIYESINARINSFSHIGIARFLVVFFLDSHEDHTCTLLTQFIQNRFYDAYANITG